MIADYFTLLAVAKALNEVLRGSTLAEAFTQEKNQLILRFSGGTGDDGTAPGNDHWVLVSCEPSRNYVLLQPSYSRARRNTLDVLSGALGLRVLRTRMHDTDRQIAIELDNGKTLLIQMFRSSANVLLADAEGRILDFFLHSRKPALTVAPSAPTHAAPSSQEEFALRLLSCANLDLKSAFKKIYPFVGPVVLEELSHRSEQPLSSRVTELSTDRQGHLFGVLTDLLRELREQPSPRLYHTEVGLLLFSLIPLKNRSSQDCESFPSVHDAIRTYLVRSIQNKEFLQEKEELREKTDAERRRAVSTLEKALREDEKLAGEERCDHLGGLVLAHLAEIPEGASTVTLRDETSDPPSPVVITLDPRLSTAQNAERFFRRAKQARKSRGELQHRLMELRKRLTAINDLLKQLSSVETPSDLETLRAAHPEFLPRRSQAKRGTGPAERLPFRVFHVAGGFEVWVGKSSENNDLLTMKRARPDDLWFHARGSSGSHVVLRTSSAKGEPPRQALVEAAAIAAYYSKMKGAKGVPVAMTRRKYVRKPRGAPPGTVTIEREKLLFVEPALPARGQSGKGT